MVLWRISTSRSAVVSSLALFSSAASHRPLNILQKFAARILTSFCTQSLDERPLLHSTNECTKASSGEQLFLFIAMSLKEAESFSAASSQTWLLFLTISSVRSVRLRASGRFQQILYAWLSNDIITMRSKCPYDWSASEKQLSPRKCFSSFPSSVQAVDIAIL